MGPVGSSSTGFTIATSVDEGDSGVEFSGEGYAEGKRKIRELRRSVATDGFEIEKS